MGVIIVPFIMPPKKFDEDDKPKKRKKKIKPAVELRVRAKIDNGEDYIKIPNNLNKNILIRREEILKGKNWTDTHYELAENGLFMPSPALFMPYFLSVKDASEGRIKLQDGNDQYLPRDEIENIWKYLTTEYKNGCWTWLDALFKEEIVGYKIETDHKVFKRGDSKELQGIESRLKLYLRKDIYVNLDFNEEGLPKTISQNQNYSQGNNIYFCHPEDDSVSTFRANSALVYIGCGLSPSISFDGLGVLACAELRSYF